MQRLLTSYESGDELEIRYYIDPRVKRPAECVAAKHPAGFRATLDGILSKLGGTAAAQHHRIIDIHVGTLRKRIAYDMTDARVETWCNKTQRMDWVEPNDFGGLRVALARETPAVPTKISAVDRIAIKYRLSYILDSWTTDISAVKICDLATIQSAKLKLVAARDPLDLWAWWDHWEFERELIPGVSADVLTVDTLYESYRVFAPQTNYAMLESIRKIASLIDHPKIGSFQRLSPRNTIARLLPKAVEPTLEDWIENYAHALTDMIIRDKIDGVRELVWISQGRIRYVSSKLVTEHAVDVAADYVFDCEFHDGTWYVLHVLVWEGAAVTDLCDSERLKFLDQLPAIAALQACPARLVKAGEDVLEWWQRAVPYPRDGFILSTDDTYFRQKNLKWKPEHESTVDFLIAECPDWLVGKAPFTRDTETIYILNVGAAAAPAKQFGFPLKRYLDIFHLDKTTPYAPQPFSPANFPNAYIWRSERTDLHGAIGEFIYHPVAPKIAPGGVWHLRRVRDDKPSLLRGGTEMGNDVKTAMDIWSKITNPFPVEYIWAPPAVRVSRYDSLAAPVASIIADMIEEEAVTTALVHMCPFIPVTAAVRGALMPVRPTDAFAPYRVDLSNNSKVIQVMYDQIARIELPKEFIGGAQLFVTMDPELLGHVSCLSKVVAAGGRMVVICRPCAGDDPHPEVGMVALMKDMDRAGFTLIQDHGPPTTDAWDVEDEWSNFAILSFRKENRGSSDMRPEDVHKENPHLAANPDANFRYKFSRQKTKDIAGLIGRAENCRSLAVDPAYGELLIDIEFLSTVAATAHVLYVNVDARRIAHLGRLFPEMHFHTQATATADTIEVVISHCAYDMSLELIKTYEPHCGLLDFSHVDLTRRVLRGRVMLHPYAAFDSTKVSLTYGRLHQEWNISPEIFRQEMQTFHQIYRPTAFKYAARCGTLDNCYDCRADIYIVTKYAKCQKITLDEARRRINSA